MYQREPEKNNWFHLDPQKVEQEQDSEIDSNRETIMKYAALPYCQFIVYRFVVQSIVLT